MFNTGIRGIHIKVLEASVKTIPHLPYSNRPFSLGPYKPVCQIIGLNIWPLEAGLSACLPVRCLHVRYYLPGTQTKIGYICCPGPPLTSRARIRETPATLPETNCLPRSVTVPPEIWLPQWIMYATP